MMYSLSDGIFLLTQACDRARDHACLILIVGLGMTFAKLVNWLTLADYEQEKNFAVKSIIAKQSRGNILAQDGECMDGGELTSLSKEADASLERLKRSVARA